MEKQMKTDDLISIMENKGPSISIEALSDFEKMIGYALPSDYREFLIRCNGGRVEAGLVVTLQDGTEKCAIDYICGLRDGPGLYSLVSIYGVWRDRIPKGLICI